MLHGILTTETVDNMEMVVLIKIIYYFQIQRKYLISYLYHCQRGTNAINFIWLVYLMARMMKINRNWNFGLIKISIVKVLHSSWANEVPESVLSKSVVVIQLAVALAKESLMSIKLWIKKEQSPNKLAWWKEMVLFYQPQLIVHRI